MNDFRITRACPFCGEREHLRIDEGAFPRVEIRDGKVQETVWRGCQAVSGEEYVDAVYCLVCDSVAALDVWNHTRPASDYVLLRDFDPPEGEKATPKPRVRISGQMAEAMRSLLRMPSHEVDFAIRGWAGHWADLITQVGKGESLGDYINGRRVRASYIDAITAYFVSRRGDIGGIVRDRIDQLQAVERTLAEAAASGIHFQALADADADLGERVAA